MRTKSISLTTLLAAGAAAVAIVAAPMANAAPTGTTNSGGASVVQSPGNAQVTARPGEASVQAGDQQYPFSGFTPLELHHQVEHHRR